jgi:fructokinase
VIAIVGEALIDLVDSGDGATFRALPGGSPYNVAVATSRLGTTTRLVARLSDDSFGHLLTAHARSSGVDLSHAVPAAGFTTLAVTTIGEDGAAAYEFRADGNADWRWRASELAGLDEAAIVHFGSIASWHSPGDGVIRTAVSAAGSLVTYDPNVRPGLVTSREGVCGAIEHNVARAHVVKASEEDVDWLYPDASAAEVARRWLAAGPSLVILTAGADGATAYRRARPALHRPAVEITVVDTVGAGDAFMAGLLVGLYRRDIRSGAALDAMAEQAVRAVLDEALLAAALTCARAGADPPWAAELAAAAVSAS